MVTLKASSDETSRRGSLKLRRLGVHIVKCPHKNQEPDTVNHGVTSNKNIQISENQRENQLWPTRDRLWPGPEPVLAQERITSWRRGSGISYGPPGSADS
jgi:hypothetical protein